MNVGCQSCKTVYRVDPSKVPESGVRARCTMCSEIIEVSSTGPEPKQTPEFTPARATSAPVRVAPEPRPTPPQLTPIVEPTVAEEAPASGTAVPTRGRRRVTRPISAPPTPAPPPVRTPVLEPPVRVEPEEHVAAAPVKREGPLSIVPPAPPVEEPEAPTAPDRPSAPVFRPEPGPPMAAPPVPRAVEKPRPAPEATVEVEREPPMTAPAAEPVAVEAPAPEKKAPINPFLARDPRQKARRLARALVSDMIVYQPDKRQQALAAGNLKEAFEEEIQKSWEEYVDQIGPELANSTPYFTEALNDILAGGQNLF